MSHEDNLSLEFARERASQIKVQHYDLFLNLHSGSKEYEAKVQIELEVLKPGSDIALDAICKEIQSLRVGGVEIQPELKDHKLILPAECFENPGKATIQIEFVNEYDTTGVALHRFEDPEDGAEYLFTDNEPFEAHKIFPCFNQPDLKASIELRVEAPESWVVISNELERLEEENHGRKLWAFERTKPVSMYLFALIAGDYETIVDEDFRYPLRTFCRKSMRSYLDDKKLFEITRNCMDYYEDHFEFEYPFGKYDQVFVPEYPGGAMENIGLVVFTEQYLFRHKPTYQEVIDYYNTVAHEMAHMWHGDIITMKWWGDLWLKEAVATYYGYRTLVPTSEFKDSMLYFTQDVKSAALYEDQLATTHPIVCPCPDTNTAFDNFDSITYEKAASVMKQLMFVMGEEEFRKALVEVVKTYQYDCFDHEDFMNVMQKYTEVDLKDWSERWLKTTHVNLLIPELVKENGVIQSFQVVQKAHEDHPVLRPHALKVGFFRLEGDDLVMFDERRIHVDGELTVVNEFEGLAAPDFFLLNFEDHAYIRTWLDPESIGFFKDHYHKFKDPLVRQVALNAISCMVEELQWSPLDFLEFVHSVFDREELDSICSFLLGNYYHYLSSYIPREKRLNFLRTHEQSIKDHLRNDGHSYEVHTAWFRILLLGMESEEKLDELISYFDKNRVGQLELDVEKRWTIVRKLAYHHHGGFGKALMIMEKEDRSDSGRKNAFGARIAASKDKVQAFEEVIHAKLSRDHLKAAMHAFFHEVQKEECKEVFHLYFEKALEIFQSRDRIFCREYGMALFPSSFGKEALEKTRALLSQSQIPASLKRALLENRDRLQKRLKIEEEFFSE